MGGGYRDTETMTAVEMSVQVTVWVGVTETLMGGTETLRQ